MENKTNEELQKELEKITGLMVNKMGNQKNTPKKEIGFFYGELQDLQNKMDAIRNELDKRMSNT